MDGTDFSQRALGLPLDALFKDVYRQLDDVQESRDQNEIIAKSILHCSRELHNLERIHNVRWRFYGAEVEDDPFDIRDVLHKFSISCNALAYMISPSGEFDDEVPEGCLFPTTPKRGWKKRQMKTLEADFLEHERNISMALSNTV